MYPGKTIMNSELHSELECVAFDGAHQIAAGALREVALKVQKIGSPNALIFDAATSDLVDIDLSGTPRELAKRLTRTAPPDVDESTEPRPPGRPKLGVVAREVTLLPRHWEWLSLQPGGASVALRKLIDEARRTNRDTDRLRLSKEAAYRFMTALAGNEQGFEEALRGLFAADADRFAQHSRTWPVDVRQHAAKLAARVFQGSENTP